MIAEKQCSIGKPFTDEEISVALAKIIKGCAQDREDRMCDLFLWKEKPDVAQEHVKIDHVEDFMRKHISQYKGEGGIILLIYAAVATRRPDVVRQDITAGLGGPSLIEPGTWFCNTDIISLLLRGVANGDIGEPEDGPVKDFDVHTGVGLLSIEEYNGIPIAEVLKSPKLPVWILHNGSHFTTLFDERGQNQDLLTPPTTLFHWNGLPPEGPRMMKLKVKAKTVSKGKKNAYFKPLPGEIEDVVGPKSEDKKRRPKQWKSWSYEVILAIDDPTVQGAERPPDLPVHIFDLGEEPKADWRCASCYRERYATFFFGANESTDEVCTKCKVSRFPNIKYDLTNPRNSEQKTKVEAGWSIWLPYESLPIEWQRKKDRQYDKLLGILRTKWPDCEILSRE